MMRSEYPGPKPAPEAESPAAVVYCRVSTREQVHNLSLETQQAACRDYCQRNGWSVAYVFVEEGESAKTADRTQLQAALRYCEEKRRRVRFFVVYRLDRFARQQYDHVVVATKLRSFGITLRSATEPIDDSSTGKLVENMVSAIAQFDNDVRSERTKAGMRRLVEQGRWPFAVPLGYRRAVDAEGRPTLEMDPEQGPLVRLAFELVASGRVRKFEALREVTALGLRTRQGRPLRQQRLQDLLRNPIYCGLLTVRAWGMEGVRGSFEPVVSEDLFEAVQAVLDGRARKSPSHRRDHPEFPLRRFVQCRGCGLPLTGSRSRGRGGRLYPYYRCRGRRCGPSIPTTTLEQGFQVFLRALEPSGGYEELYRAIVRDVWEQRRQQAGTERTTLERNLAKLEGQRMRLLEAFAYRRAVERELYGAEDARLRAEIDETRRSLQARREDLDDLDELLDFAVKMASNAAGLWAEGTLVQRQRLQAAIFPRGVAYSVENGFETAETSLFFGGSATSDAPNSAKVSPTGFEPVLPA